MSIFDGITNYAVANKGNDEGYRHLREEACKLRESWLDILQGPEIAERFADLCRDDEDRFLEINYGSDPNAKHVGGKRDGQWKYRTLLPQAYNTAKTSLTKALDAGIDPAGVGKTELDKLRTQATQNKKSPQELVTDAIDTLFTRLSKVTGVEAHKYAETIREGLTSRGY